MSGFKVNFSVNNQLATPSIHAAALANRPAAGQPGRVFIDTDNPSTGIYRDTGTAWVQIAETSDPEADTLQTVSDRGNTTTQSITINANNPPQYPLDVYGDTDIINVHATNGNDGVILFSKAGSHRWRAGNYHGGGNDYFSIYNMQENADAILVNISSNNVAIGGGVVAPSYRLDVQGSLRNTGNALLATSGGNVGINTTTPNSYAGYTAMNVNDNATGAIVVLSRSNVITGRMFVNASVFQIGSQTNLPFVIEVNNNEKLRIFNTGNISVGSSTDAGYKFDVNGTARVSGTELRLDNGTTGTLNIYSATPVINFFSSGGYTFGRSGTAMTWNSSGSINMQIGSNNGYSLTGANGHIFYTANSGGAGLARLDTGGSLSIGNGTSAANVSSILDLTSTTKGFLPPRMTGAQAEAIGTPAAGLLVYANNGNGVTITTTGWWGYDGATWVKLN